MAPYVVAASAFFQLLSSAPGLSSAQLQMPSATAESRRHRGGAQGCWSGGEQEHLHHSSVEFDVLFFLLQSLDDDCTLEEEDDGLVEEEDEIDQFNDDTFGAGAIGESDFRIFVFSLRLASEINMIDQLLIMFQKSRLSNGN